MDWDKINQLVNKIRSFDDGSFSTEFVTSPASESTIQETEKLLGVTFPDSYREFLRKFGTIYCADCALSGIHDDNANETDGGSVLGDTQRLREEFQLPEGLIVISADDDAPFCLDLNSHLQEPPVVLFQTNTCSTHELEPSFESFFINRFLPGVIDVLEA